MGSWIRSITSPLRKSCVFLHSQEQQQEQEQQQRDESQSQSQNQQKLKKREKKGSSKPGLENKVMDLQNEVMACAYEDVQVMWSMLDKSKTGSRNVSP